MAEAKMERDFSNEVDAAIKEANQKSTLDQALELLLNLEKQSRGASDVVSTGRLLVRVVELCFEKRDLKSLKEHLVLLSKKRGQLKMAITKMVNRVMEMIPLVVADEKLDLIQTLRQVTEGKIYVEVERARLTKMISDIKEKEGNIREAADILHELQIETFGSMEKREKAEFILEQMRLGIANQDFVRTQIISRKISSRFLQDKENQNLKLSFYKLMVLIGLHDSKYLDVCKYYRQIFECQQVQENQQLLLENLKLIAIFISLAPFDNEQNDLIHKIKADRNLESLPFYKELLKCLITDELVRWPAVEKVFKTELTQSYVFAQDSIGQERWKDLRKRIIEHNLRVIAKYYTRITIKRLTELLDLNAKESEEFIAVLVTSKTIYARMDRPSGIITFKKPIQPAETLNNWSRNISNLLQLIVKTNHLITKEEMVFKIKSK